MPPIALPSLRVATLTALLLLAGFARAGEIYSWKDANGRTHYSDVKPNSDTVKAIQTPRAVPAKNTSPGAQGDAKAAEPDDPETAFRKRRTAAIEAEAKADKERQEAALAKENCDAMSAQLTALKSGERMARYNSAGEKEVIDDSTRASEIARLERNVAASCQ